MNDKPKPKPKPAAPKPVVETTEVVENAPATQVYDAIVGDLVETDIKEVETLPEPGEKKEAAAKKPGSITPPPTTYAVVSAAEKDSVSFDKIIFKNMVHRKSLSVHHMQRRLAEWGYPEANLDKDGYFGDSTLEAIHKFQNDHGLVVGELTFDTLSAIFEGDTNVIVTH